MKKILLTLMIVLLTGLAAQAATRYEINVGGVEVTSDNCNNVTGGDIKSGTVKYNSTTNVLTLTNVTIKRNSGSGNFALHNRACSGLEVKFVGDNYLYSKDGPAIKVNSGVGLILNFDGGENEIHSDNNDAIFVQSNSNYFLRFCGTGHVYVHSEKTYGMRSDAECIAMFEGSSTGIPLNVDMYGPKGAINWVHQVTFNNFCNVVKLKATNNSSYPVITAGCISFLIAYGDRASIIDPPGAVVSSDETTINYNGSPVYNQDIVIATSNVGYVATINARNFPDANFRDYLLSLYPKGYLTDIDINNRKVLNVYNKGIYNLTGIEYFTALESLTCSDNSLTSLNLSNNTKLTFLACDYNNLTSITGIPSTLQRLFCNNNRFTSFTMTGRSALILLDISNCTSLTSLNCSRNNLTSLDVSGCTALTDLRCYENADLRAITGLEDCTAITYLDCEDCKIRDLSAVNSMENITKLYARNNMLTSLIVGNKYELNYLRVSGNSQLTYLYVSANYELKTLDASNCTALIDMYCYNCGLTTLNVSGNTAMTQLECSWNEFLTSISGLADCTALKILCCDVSSVTDLGNVRRFTNLETLGCVYTKITKLECDDMEHLKKVCCSDNPQLTTLNVSNCDQLVTLDCFRCPALTKLIIDSDGLNGKLTSLDLTGTTALEYLSCSGQTGLSTITNLANCTSLKELYCRDCAFTSLSAISGMTKLEMLYCSDNKLTSLNLANNTKLTELDFSGNSGLTTVTGLANCTALEFLGCENCALTSLNGFSSLSKLEELNCHNNQLTSLNLQGCSSLETLRCFNNRLTSLTVNGLAALKIIMCHNNQLTSLNVSGCSALTSIQCYKNRISGSGMTTLVNSLPTRTSSSKGNLYAIYNTDEGNTMTAAQATTAKNKYWTPKCYNGSSWVEYVPSAPTEAYAVYTSSNTTLTFYCDNQRSSRSGTTYDLNTGSNNPGWVTDNTNSAVTRVVFNSTFAGARPTTTYKWFILMSNLQSITGMTYLNTSSVTNMALMFYGCNRLTSLDLSNFNTAKVTDMSSMFQSCVGLESLDLSSFNTAKVTNMSFMFFNCTGLESLNLSSFNTANVTNMSGMFMGCIGLTNIDVNNFNTAKVTDMSAMFANCYGLKRLNLKSFNTAKVTDMTSMFSYNRDLVTIYVGEAWNTSAVTSSDGMFRECTSIKGGKGTTYDANHLDKTYARIDGGPSNPGYFSSAVLLGDLNGDGVVDVADVTMMISMALGNSAANLSLADLNGDGIIDVADVTAVIRIALNGN